MNILITICGRGGSKGIPGKNIRPLNGIPLIAYTIRHAQEFAKHHPCDIALSTDDDGIKSTAAAFGLASDYTRPAALATDTAGKVPVIAHLRDYEQIKRGKEYDYVLDLDVSAPIRTTADLLDGFNLLLARPEAYNLFSVNTAHKNPYFNMVEADGRGYFGVSKPLPAGVESRQQAPKVYEMNASFYFYSRRFFEDGLHGAVTGRSLVYEMPHICFDLDHMIDFEFLEYLVTNRKLTL